MRDFEDTGTRNVVVLRFLGIQNLLYLRRIRDPVLRQQKRLEILGREMPVWTSMRILRTRRV